MSISKPWTLGVTGCFAALLATSSANAQQDPGEGGLALNRFNPSHAGDRMFGSPSPFSPGDPALHLMLLGDYAHNPLVIVRDDGSSDEEIGSVVGDQLFVHLNGTLALFHRLSINVDVPIALVQSGDDPSADGSSFASPDSAHFGDIRLGARLTVLGEYHDPIQLGVGGYVWLPTGGDDNFTGDGTARGMPYLTLGGNASPIVWSVFAGPEIRDAKQFGGIDQGTMLNFGGGLGVLFGDRDQFQIGPEFYAALTVDDVQKRTTNAEALLDFRWRPIDDLETGIGIGPGLASGIGTPDLRGVLMVAYSPKIDRDRDGDGIDDAEDACPDIAGPSHTDPALHGCPPPPPDSDGDGIFDAQDACPQTPGVPSDDPSKHGCPLPIDSDGDGIFDPQDACPTVPGEPNQDPSKHGCPPPLDSDGDGIIDPEDACPTTAGAPHDDPAQHGCPDTDGDLIRDPVDACPKEKGAEDPDPAKNGCPKAVRVTDDEIVILQKVEFDTAKATIKAVSAPLLDEVAQVLKDHTEITKIEVQGHTDDRGADLYNRNLSDQRAKAVRQALIERGVEADRLTAKGYGEEEPIADNSTEEGRQDNRRVQFKIVEKQ